MESKRVGIIGTGSSVMESIPHLARWAKHLTGFQRTPNYSFSAKVDPVGAELQEYVKAHYRELREMQRASAAGISGMQMPTADGGSRAVGAGVFSGQSSASSGGTIDREALAKLLEQFEGAFAGMVRKRVHDPEVAEALIPKDYRMGCKRLVVEIDYFETFNRPNVTLVDLRKGGITEITPTSVVTEQGTF